MGEDKTGSRLEVFSSSAADGFCLLGYGLFCLQKINSIHPSHLPLAGFLLLLASTLSELRLISVGSSFAREFLSSGGCLNLLVCCRLVSVYRRRQQPKCPIFTHSNCFTFLCKSFFISYLHNFANLLVFPSTMSFALQINNLPFIKLPLLPFHTMSASAGPGSITVEHDGAAQWDCKCLD
jgi:hypothetical protein